MKYAYSAAQLAFKQEVEAFLSEHLPADLAHSVRCGAGISKDQLAAWTRVLNAKGWAAPHWPVAHGGVPGGIWCIATSSMLPVGNITPPSCRRLDLAWSGRQSPSTVPLSNKLNTCRKY